MIKIAFSLILFFSIFDYYRINTIKEEMTDFFYENEISNKNEISNNNSLINIEVQYCSSWGFKNYFEEMQNAFLSNFKNVKINGKVYAVSQTKQFLIYLVYIVQLFMMVLIFLPDFGKSLNMFPDTFFEYLEEKKWFLMLLVFFMGNFITGIIGNSGAFEVYVNKKLVFSKLGIGRVPNLDEIVSLIRKMDLQLIGVN